MQDLALNLIASAISFALGVFGKLLYDRLRRGRSSAELVRRLRRGNPAYTAPWIIRYYEKAGRGDELYESRTVLPGHKLQFLVKPSWILDTGDDRSLLVQEVPQKVVLSSIDRRALRRRGHAIKSAAGEHWNDYHSCALQVEETEDGPRIHVGVCRYLQYLSVSGSLEDETFRAVERRSKRRPPRAPLRDRGFSSVDDAARGGLGVHSIGMVTAFVYKDGESEMVLIHRRSPNVSTYSGALGVVPMFSCQTTDLGPATEVSLTNNFLRELYEELYGGLEAQSASTRVQKNWYESVEELAPYVSPKSREKLRIIGFGFDARNAQLIIGSIFTIDDPTFVKTEIPRMRGNWEMSDIDIISLRGLVMKQFLLADQFTPACAFTLTRALELLS